MSCCHLSLETFQLEVCASQSCCQWANGRNFCLLPVQRGIWAPLCCTHSHLSTLVPAIWTILHFQALPLLSTRQNWRQDTCKVLMGALKSQILYGQENFLGARTYFVLGAVTSKIKPRAETPTQTQTPTNLFCRESPPGTDTLRQHEQRHTEARPAPEAPIPVHRVLPKTNLSAAALVPQVSASAQEDETMQADIKHRSTGKLLSRLSWTLRCQVQSSALPVRAAWMSSPFPSGEGSALLPQIRRRWNLWQPFPVHSSLPAAWDRDDLSYICLCSIQLPTGSCRKLLQYEG